MLSTRGEMGGLICTLRKRMVDVCAGWDLEFR